MAPLSGRWEETHLSLLGGAVTRGWGGRERSCLRPSGTISYRELHHINDATRVFPGLKRESLSSSFSPCSKHLSASYEPGRA